MLLAVFNTDSPEVDPDSVRVCIFCVIPPRLTVKVCAEAAEGLIRRFPFIVVTPKKVSVTEPEIVGVMFKFTYVGTSEIFCATPALYTTKLEEPKEILPLVNAVGKAVAAPAVPRTRDVPVAIEKVPLPLPVN